MANVKTRQSQHVALTYNDQTECHIKIRSERNRNTSNTRQGDIPLNQKNMAQCSCTKSDAKSTKGTCGCGAKTSMLNINVPIVCILGGPGCGKGTQCDRIMARYNLVHLSTGDLIREEVESKSPRAEQLSTAMEKGELISNEVMLEILKSAIKKNQPSAKGFLLDGYPREKSQGVLFERAIAPITTILFFDANPDILTQRIMHRALDSGRADDNEECILKRLDTFNTHTSDILEQFKAKVIKINAERDIDQIFTDVQRALDPIFNVPSGQKKGMCGCAKQT